MPKPFKPYELNSSPPLSNVQIVEILQVGEYQRDTFYKIKFLCCGDIKRASHVQVRKRENDGKRKIADPNRSNTPPVCPRCYAAVQGDIKRKNRLEEKDPRGKMVLQIPLPVWPVPPSVLKETRGKSL